MKRVFVIGSNKFVMKRLKEYGHYIIYGNRLESPLSKFADKSYVIDFNDFDKYLEVAKEEKVDAVICTSEFSVRACAYICEKLNLPGNSFESANLCKDKYEIRKKMAEMNMDNVPQFFGIKDKEEIKSIKDDIVYPVVLKPADGGGSIHTYKITSYEELEENIEDVIEGSKNHVALIESFIEGDEYSVEVFINDCKTHIMAITERQLTELPYRVTLGLQCPADISIDREQAIEKAIFDHVTNLGIKQGAANFDIIISNENGGVYILDTNARLGGNGISTHVVKYSTGIDHIENIIKVALGEKDLNLTPKYKKKVCVRIIDLDEGVVKKLPDLDKYIDDEIVAIDFTRQLGEKCNKFSSLAERSGIIVACGDDFDKLKEKSEKVRDLINKEVLY